MANEDVHDIEVHDQHSALNEEECFTITWRVKNFSMCPVRYIESPVFLIKQLGEDHSRWWLRLYPCEEDYVSCDLMHKTFAHIDLKIKFTVSLIPYSSDIVLLTAETDFIPDEESWGIGKLISTKDINKYLSNDTLTIRSSIKFPSINGLRNIKMKVLKTLSRELIYPITSLNKCFVETTIPVSIKRISWPIRNFLSLPVNERIALPVYSVLEEIPSFFVSIIKSDTSIHLEIKKCNDFKGFHFVRCTVSATNTPKGVDYSFEHDFVFESGATDIDDFVSFSPSLDLKKLEENGYFKLYEGALYLRFEFTFSNEQQIQHIEKQDWEPFFPPIKHPVPLEMFTTSATDEKHDIVTIRTGNRNFSVHKTLLKAKSEVFKAMFKNDMKEKKTGVVDIPDVDPHTVEQMLSFFYCGSAGDLSTTDVKSLYAAANKYQVQSLMDYGSSVLKSSLTVSNVCEMLHLADFYGDEQLFKTAEDFVVANSTRIFMSQDWKHFMKTKSSLAAEVMHNILMKGL